MKNMRLSSVLIMIGLALIGYGQGVPFVNYLSDARSAAMGYSGYADESPFAVQRNAAVMMLRQAPSTQLAASLLLWQPQMADNKLINIAGYTRSGKIGFGAGMRYNSFPSVKITDFQGNITGDLTPREMVAEVGAGFNLHESLSLGANLRYIYSDLGGLKKASAFAADISALFQPSDNLNLSAGIGSVGTAVDYGEGKSDLPTRIQTGVAYKLLKTDLHQLNAVADLGYQLAGINAGVIAGAGAEYTYRELVSLRTGYRYETEKAGPSFASVGAGLHLFGFTLDLAYMLTPQGAPMQQTMLVSLRWKR